ncbi:sensor histidine kinase [Rufibacter latericius]|uniref:histidine kinase n=1 Tax=Rufibacter latericius TaxID=2487040 RepID=A0A3M9MF09_9BACT|nr:PAS domain-containing sensor histidine kinase [Rufibacter latericius]RNI24151.1 PAS domain-containing sensor histidine kinase [Rufibacter latericius]
MDKIRSADSINSFFVNQVKDYAIFATDTKGIITAWNIGAERLKGYSEEEIVGQFYGILHPDEYQRAGYPEKELRKALEDGSYENEDWRRKKDGSLFWANVTLTSIFDGGGRHIGFTKITGDLTKQKELQDKLAERQQDALERKNNELQRTNKDLDNLIYTASHDLRSPITNIEALVLYLEERLQESNSLTGETREVLGRIAESIHRFKHTIEDLSEISKLQKTSAEEEIDGVVTNIKEVYEDIMADLEYPTKRKTCFIQTDFEVSQLNFSRKNFRSILYNLLSNAIKYKAPDRDCIIHVTTRLEEPYVELRVKDNGLGINAKQQKQLYGMFRRFHDHVEGTGIGLFMVKRIVDNADGKIEVESKEGEGTEFKVYLQAAM